MIANRVTVAALSAILPLVGGCFFSRPHTARYGAGWYLSDYPDWEYMVSRSTGVATYSSNSIANGFGLSYERRFTNPYAAGLSIRHDTHRVELTYQDGYPVNRGDFRVNGWSVGPFVARRWNPREWMEVQITGGPVILVNRGVFEWLDILGLLTRDQRTHTGLNWDAGSSLTFKVSNRWGFETGFRRTGWGIRDANNNNTVFVKAVFDQARIAR